MPAHKDFLYYLFANVGLMLFILTIVFLVLSFLFHLAGNVKERKLWLWMALLSMLLCIVDVALALRHAIGA